MKNYKDKNIPSNKPMDAEKKGNSVNNSSNFVEKNDQLEFEEDNNVSKENIYKNKESKKKRGKNDDFINDWDIKA